MALRLKPGLGQNAAKRLSIKLLKLLHRTTTPGIIILTNYLRGVPVPVLTLPINQNRLLLSVHSSWF